MNRSDLKEKLSVVTDKVDSQLNANPKKFLVMAVAASYFAGILWAFTLPVIFLVGVIGGVLWTISDEGDSSGKSKGDGPLDQELNGSNKDKSGSDMRQ